MRFGRLGVAGVVTLLLGCATAEPIADDDGLGGAPAGGNTGTGGKADNPGGGGGGASSGGTAGAAGSAGTSSGGTSSGGTSSGGTSSGGASSGGTSSGGTSSGGSGGSCGSGKKMCGGVCITPSPGVGCGSQDNVCTVCPSPPANSTSVCNGTLCDFTCNSGFTKSGNSCLSSGGGGAPGGGGGGGTSGAGGSSGCAAPCDPKDVAAQFLCTFYCATKTGNPGLCAPVLNCCTCP